MLIHINKTDNLNVTGELIKKPGLNLNNLQSVTKGTMRTKVNCKPGVAETLFAPVS